VIPLIVDRSAPVTLVGGGDASPQDLQKALTLAPHCVAADGGAVLALDAGRIPEAVIGDFDSLPDAARRRIPPDRLHHVAEQDSTDFAKCLMRIRAPLIIGVGFTGKRVDHTLAALNALVAFAHQPCVLLSADEVIFHAPPRFELDMAQGDVVSLFPMTAVEGRSTGLEWPIDGLAFAPGRRVGTSNRATGAVTLDMVGPGMLVMLPRRAIGPVVSVLQAPGCAPWPVRAG
jgi:thiamine pyrophosphokinase